MRFGKMEGTGSLEGEAHHKLTDELRSTSPPP